jgi:hypothetical protein
MIGKFCIVIASSSHSPSQGGSGAAQPVPPLPRTWGEEEEEEGKRGKGEEGAEFAQPTPLFPRTWGKSFLVPRIQHPSARQLGGSRNGWGTIKQKGRSSGQH